ncbi:hypothetical protein ACA910_010446 [Epithemia clementina (nom. ined.)]
MTTPLVASSTDAITRATTATTATTSSSQQLAGRGRFSSSRRRNLVRTALLALLISAYGYIVRSQPQLIGFGDDNYDTNNIINNKDHRTLRRRRNKDEEEKNDAKRSGTDERKIVSASDCRTNGLPLLSSSSSKELKNNVHNEEEEEEDKQPSKNPATTFEKSLIHSAATGSQELKFAPLFHNKTNKEFATETAIATDSPPPPSPKQNKKQRIIGVYVCSDFQDERQQRQLNELYSYFHDQLVVVTDLDRTTLVTPFQEHFDFSLDEQVVAGDADQNVTGNHSWNWICCGLERAFMWLADHPSRFDHAWMMEDDLYWTNFTEFAAFLDSFRDDDEADLLHQNAVGQDEPTVTDSNTQDLRNWHYSRLLPPMVKPAAKVDMPYYFGWFMFYRISYRTVQHLNRWRVDKNDGDWTFFEPLLATLPHKDPNLVLRSFHDNKVNYNIHLRYRPCFEHDDIYGQGSIFPRGGLFHPVKKHYRFCNSTH